MSFVEEIKYDLCLLMFTDDDDQNAKHSMVVAHFTCAVAKIGATTNLSQF